MKDMRILIVGFFFSFIVGVSISPDLVAQDLELSIIGNAQSVPDEMDMNQLISVFKGERLRWDDGTAIKVALMKTNTPVGMVTCKRIYNMTGNELNKYFLALVFQGKVKAPTFFNSVRDLEDYIAETPGAIGVSQNTTKELIKVVLIDGKKQI